MGQVHNITIDQGSTFTMDVQFVQPSGAPVDLTGYTAKMQARSTYGAATSIFSLTSTPAAGLVITPLTGTVSVTISSTITDALTPEKYVYDLEITSAGGQITRLLEGRCTVSPQVTV